MVAIADGVRSLKSGIGSGFRRSVEFQTEAPSDIALYRSELDGMSEVGGLAHLAGAVCGGIVDIVTLGHFERKSFRELTYGKSDVSYSGGDVMDFVKRYEVAHGLEVEEDNVSGNLEKSVGDKATRNRYDIDKGCWVYEEIGGGSDVDTPRDFYVSGDHDEVEVFIDDDGNVHDIGPVGYVASNEDVEAKDSYGRRRYFAGEGSKAKKRGRSGELEDSVDVAGIEAEIKEAGKRIDASKKTIRSVVDHAKKAIESYEAKTGRTLNGEVLSVIGDGVDDYAVGDLGDEADEGISPEGIEKYMSAWKDFADDVDREHKKLLDRRALAEYFVGLDMEKVERVAKNKAYIKKARADREAAEKRQIDKIERGKIYGISANSLDEFISEAKDAGMPRNEIEEYKYMFSERDGRIPKWEKFSKNMSDAKKMWWKQDFFDLEVEPSEFVGKFNGAIIRQRNSLNMNKSQLIKDAIKYANDTQDPLNGLRIIEDAVDNAYVTGYDITYLESSLDFEGQPKEFRNLSQIEKEDITDELMGRFRSTWNSRIIPVYASAPAPKATIATVKKKGPAKARNETLGDLASKLTIGS